MYRRLVGWQVAVGILVGIGALPTAVLAQLPEPPPPLEGPGAPTTVEMPPVGEAQEGVDVLTRGPVHEAFAEPLVEQSEGTMVVPKQPPKEIDEVPPDVKPEGEDVVWIPGYWAWDDDRKDFIWISGIWRKSPPNRQWVPGYWTEAEGGWQWVPGLWAAEDADELQYREPPPRTLEAGPSSPMPSENHFWVPGSWLWYESGYRWRPGFWSPYRTDWVWIPAHWAWTPRGCVFVPGYWDYRPTHRGYLYAPVYFHAGVWQRPLYRYSPRCVVDIGPLMMHFWIRPRHRHYYFGDYYGPNYVALGFTPWHRWSYHHRGHHYDPLLTHFDVHYRNTQHIDYVSRMRQWHGYYDKHVEERPRHTYADQIKFVSTRPQNISPSIKQSLMAAHVDVVAKRPDAKIVHIAPDHRNAFLAGSKQVRQFTDDRRQTEKFGIGKLPPGGTAKTPPPGAKPPSGSTLKLSKTIGVPTSRPHAASTPPALETHTTRRKPDDSIRLPSVGDIKSKPKAPGTQPIGPKTPSVKLPTTTPKIDPIGPKTPSVKLPTTTPKVDPIGPRTPSVKLPTPTPRVDPVRPRLREREPAPQPRIETPRPRIGPSGSGGSSSGGSFRDRDRDRGSEKSKRDR